MILFLPNRHFYSKIQCLFPSKTKSKKSIPVNLLTTQLNFLDFPLNILFKMQNTFKSHRDRFSHFWFTYVFLVTVPPPLWKPYLRDSAPQAHRQPSLEIGNHSQRFWSKSQMFHSKSQKLWSKSQRFLVKISKILVKISKILVKITECKILSASVLEFIAKKPLILFQSE